MSLPNKTSKNDAVLFECDCGGYHYLEVFYEKFEEKIMFGAGLWFNYLDHGVSLLRVLKSWWKDRVYWHSEVLLSPDDVKAMHEKLGKYLEEYEKSKKVDGVTASTEASKTSS
jgi:hypothetical protein